MGIIRNHKIIASAVALLLVAGAALGITEATSGSSGPAGRHVAVRALNGRNRHHSDTTTTMTTVAPVATVVPPTTVPVSQGSQIVPKTPTTTRPPSPKPPTGSVVHLAAVDPTFTQSDSDPLAITYTYDASATLVTNGVSVPDNSLPQGILQLFTPTTPGGPSGLACSMTVGGATTGGTCNVEYHDTGAYQVTATYTSGTESATATETDTINPFTDAITVSDVPATNAPDGTTCTNGPGIGCQLMTATITGQGDASHPPVGTLVFAIYNDSGIAIGTLIPEVAGQTYCLVRWFSDGPPWSANATSPDCSGGASASYEIVGFPHGATFTQAGYTTASTGIQ